MEAIRESSSKASEDEVASKPAVVQEPKKICSITVSVTEPSKRYLSEGQIQLFGRRRSISSTGSSSSLKNLWGKDVWVKAELYLTETSLCYSIDGIGTCEMLLEDVIGVQLTKTPPASNPRACEFSIYLYPVVSPLAKKRSRLQCTTIIHFDDSDQFKENFQSASKWKTSILLQTQRAVKATFGEDLKSESGSKISDLNQEESVLVPRRFLVIINPVAGAKKSERLFKQYVQPKLDLADIQYIIEVTKYPNHARQFIKTCNLSVISGIIILSGDGVLNEVINGIMERADWNVAIKIPIGMIPTGTFNGLCASNLKESGEDVSVETATLQIIRGGVVPMDMATVQHSNGKSFYFVLTATWGLSSDVLQKVEKLGKIGMGKARYAIASLSATTEMKMYSGKLSYLPAYPKMLSQHDVPDTDTAQEDTSWISTEESGEDTATKEEKRSTESPAFYGTHQDDSAATATQRQAPLPQTDLLVPLTEPVPETWVTKEGNFHGVGAGLMPLLSIIKTFIDPDIPIVSGNMRLMWTGGKFTKSSALKTAMAATNPVEEGVLYRVNVKAFRLEPETIPGNIYIDGEPVASGPLQAQIHQGLARVMSRRRKI